MKKIMTWKDKSDFENRVCPAHTEGYATSVGKLIKVINDKTGEEMIVPFDPKILKLSTKVVDWYVDMD